IEAASVVLNGERVTVNRLRGRAGATTFSGIYRWEPKTERPHKFTLSVPEADAASFEALFAPTLPRPAGFFSRTLGLSGPQPAPAGLEARHAEGSIAISPFAAGDVKAREVSAQVLWDGPKVRFTDLYARLDPGSLSGDLGIDLAGRIHASFDGDLQNIA